MKRIMLLLISLPCFLHAQSFYQKRDSLLHIVSQQVPDTLRANILNKIGMSYMNTFPDSGMIYLNHALDCADKSGNKKTIGITLLNIGILEVNALNANEEGIDTLLTAAKFLEQAGQQRTLAGTFMTIGTAYYNLSSYPEAVDYMLKALTIVEKSKDTSRIAGIYSNLGLIYMDMKDYDHAKSNFELALQYEGEKISANRASMLHNLALIYSEHLHNDSIALTLYKQALEINTAIGNLNYKGYNLGNIGEIYRNDTLHKVDPKLRGNENIYKAIEYYNQAIAIADTTGDLSSKAVVSESLGEAYLKLDQIDKAQWYADQSMNISTLDELKENKIDAFSLLSKIAVAKGNYKDAYTYIRQKSELSDSIHGEAVSMQIANSQKNYEVLKRDEQIELNNEKISRQQMVNYLLMGMAALLIVMVLISFYFINQKQKSNKELSAVINNLKATQVQLVQSEKLASLGQLTAGIAHEIKNPLNFINNFSELGNELITELKSVRSDVERNEILEDLSKNLEKINQHGKRADSIVRSMLDHARTSYGEKESTDVNVLCEEFLNLSYHGMRANLRDFNCKFACHLDTKLPNVNVVTQDISRVLLNLFNNAFYAVYEKAKTETNYQPEVLVITERSDHTLIIKVRDNGMGIPDRVRQKIFEPFFTTKPSGEGTGLGLSLSYDIITKQHDGKLMVESEEGKYTEFTIQFLVS